MAYTRPLLPSSCSYKPMWLFLLSFSLVLCALNSSELSPPNGITRDFATKKYTTTPGCENCPFLDMVDNPERSNVCTSAFYEGQAALMDPRESWAAKWIRVDNYLPGVYALSITGTFDRDIEEDLEARGIRWRCRPVPSS
jgi:hypothetical protein